MTPPPRRMTGGRSVASTRGTRGRTVVSMPAAAVACVLLAAPSAAGQVPVDTAAAPPPAPTLADLGVSGFAAAAGSPHVHGTMVAVSVRIPTGSADDQPGREGTAWLLGRVRTSQAAEALDPALAVLTARVERDHTVYTLLAVPDAWERAWAVVDSLLFDAPVPGALLEARRAELLGRLTFEAGSPARDFQVEAVGLLADPASGWSRPPRGTPTSVASLRATDLEDARRTEYRRSASTVAVVGPIPELRDDVGPAATPAPPLPDTAASPGASGPGAVADSAAADSAVADSAVAPPTSPAAARQAWRVGGRTDLVREVTSTWLSVAYPAPTTLSRTALELVAHLVDEELNTVPPDPDRFWVDVRIVDAPDGPVLVIDASVLPEAADRWENRITRVVGGLAERRMEEDFFRWRRRRFRTTRLLEEARPESEAERMAADLHRSGAARVLGVEIWSLDGEALQQAAASLGAPRILRFGPDLGAQDGGGR